MYTYNGAGNTYLRYQTYMRAREPRRKQRDDNENDNDIYQHTRCRWLLTNQIRRTWPTHLSAISAAVAPGFSFRVYTRAKSRLPTHLYANHLTRIGYVSGIYLSIPRMTHVCVRVLTPTPRVHVYRVYRQRICSDRACRPPFVIDYSNAGFCDFQTYLL